MKLIGSKMEQDFRAQLLEGHKAIFDSNASFLSMLKNEFPNMTTAYVIDAIPEEAEDIYKILIDDTIVVQIEVQQSDSSYHVLDVLTISQFRHGLKKSGQIHLAVALELAKKDLEVKIG